MMTTGESLINEGVSQQNKRSGNGETSRCIRATFKRDLDAIESQPQ